jgi:chromate transport protein ChrA
VNARSNILRFILRSLGLILCVAPPIVCTLSYFPLWREAGGEQLISGGTALLLIIAVIPFYKHIRRLLETSASYVLWLVIFLFCFLMAKVIDEITVIAFVGFIGNMVGALLMKLGEKKDT